MLANWLLTDPAALAGSHEGYQQMWLWHALEETEHKAVSFDVWNTVMKPGPKRYLIRIGVYLLTTLTFWPNVFLIHSQLIRWDRTSDKSVRGLWRVVSLLYGPRHGMFPTIAREWLSFFRPSFHPWDYDNRHHLARVDAIVEATQAREARKLAAIGFRRREAGVNRGGGQRCSRLGFAMSGSRRPAPRPSVSCPAALARLRRARRAQGARGQENSSTHPRCFLPRGHMPVLG